MKKFFSFGSKKGGSSFRVTSSLRDGPGILRERRIGTNSFGWGYNIRDKDLRKIHKVASMGNVRKLQEILLSGKHGVDERDQMNRTALHLACANGHPDVVAVLVERKCQLDLFDTDYRTALMKAVQCQDERCVTILLEHGADPNLTDIAGNTALHYAALGSNTSIAEKLLLHHANIEVRNKDELTPFLLAVSENKQQMVEFLIEKEANVHAVDKLESSHQLIAEYREEKLNNDLQSKNAVADKSSEEESLSSISIKPGTDDSWPTSDDEDFNFDIKTVPKPNLRALMNASEQFKNVGTKCGLITLGGRTLSEHDNSDYEDENIVGLLYKPPFKANDFSCPAFSKPSVKSLAGHGVIKEGEVQPATGKKDNGINITESAPQEQTVNDHLTSADRAYKSNSSVTMSALGLGEEEDGESPWDSESISESLLKKDVKHLFGAVDQKGPRILNEQVEDSPKSYPYVKPPVEVKDSVPNKTVEVKEKQTSNSDWPAELDVERTSEEEQKRLDESENNHLKINEEKKRHQSNETAVLENTYAVAAAAAGLIQQRESGKTENHLFPVGKKEDSDGGSIKTSDPGLHMKGVRKDENEKWTSEVSVITPGLEKADSLPSHPPQVNDDSTSSEMDQDEVRPAKKTSHEKKEVKKQINFMDDLDLTESSGTASEDSKLPCSKYMSCKSLIVPVGQDRKDSTTLLKIQDVILSYKKLVELKKNQCKQLKRKNKEMENKVNGLQKELSETKELKLQLEHQKVKWEQELSDLRFTFKQEEGKRRNADKLYEKMREQFREKEEQYNKEVEMKQQLELRLATVGAELRTMRNNLDQVVEERNDAKLQLSREQNARVLQDGILKNHLCKQKEIEISNSHKEEKDLLPKTHLWQDEIAMLRLEIDTINSKNQEMETKYCEDIEIIKEKNVSLLKTIKLKEETLTKTVLEYSGQINALTTENTMLKSKLENEKQNKERLDTQVGSFRARLATALEDYDQSQASKRDLELAFQRAKDEWFRLQDKLNFDVSNLKENNELLSQNLSKAESEFNTLEIELHHTRDALREKTLVLECVQRDLSQTQCQKKEMEHMYQNEQDKVNKYIGKQESLVERLSQLQSENMLLHQQLDDAHNKAASKENVVINIQDQFQDIVKKLQAESEKHGLLLEASNRELINECNLLKERIYQYEKEKVEREVTVRHLQLELADALKKQSMSEASLEVTSRCRINLEDETQDLRKKLGQIRSQLQEAQDRHAEAVRCIETSKDHVQKLEVENAKLKVTVKKQACKIEQLQENLLSTSLSDEKGQIKKLIELKQSLECSLDQEMKKNGELEKEMTRFKKLLNVTRRKLSEYEDGELTFPGNSKANQIEMDSQIDMLKQKVDDLTAKLETASSKCLYLDANNQLLTQELTSMKEMQKKYEKLKKNKKKLEQQVENLRSHAEFSMVEYSKIEHYKRELEERTRLDITEKLKEANLFFQTQVASQERLGQLRETNNASIRNQMELRIKELEFELSRMKSSQEDFNKTELEKYKQLYLEELKVRMSLTNELNKTNEKLAETSTKLLVETQQKKSLINTITMRPVLELPSVRNMNNSSLFNRYVAPRENLVIPTSSSWPTKNGIETFLTKMQQEMERNITRELEEAAAEIESDSWCKTSSLESTYESHADVDLLVKSSKEYLQILKKNYMF
ncbi:ankyrin repeat domain-containing protein 26-like isoform X2 [Mirounga angustirostris]|uniref:ankyrin repeat domain-containing protein 26-like isoform X2 n=1 Tax=Mirounga angustirostris TaxID=9716 RepID=UPI00313C1013